MPDQDVSTYEYKGRKFWWVVETRDDLRRYVSAWDTRGVTVTEYPVNSETPLLITLRLELTLRNIVDKLDEWEAR